MSAQTNAQAPVDVKDVLNEWIEKVARDPSVRMDRELREARAAVAELIERDKAAQKVFDCILRGVNDVRGELGYRSFQYVPSWLEGWAKALIAAGFHPTNPDARDIKRALARVRGEL